MTADVPLADPHVMPAEAVTSLRDKGHAVVRGLASADEIATFRPAIEAAVLRHAEKQAPLAERGTYGKAFLQVTNIWQYDDVVKEFVFAPRFAKAAADLLGVDGVRLYHDQALCKEPGGGHTPWQMLRALADEDVPWVLDELFRSARRKVAVTVTTATRASVLGHGIHVSHRPRPESWWVAQLEAASCRHPEKHWQLIVHTRNACGRQVTQSCEGGRRFNSNPTVWVLTDDHPGNTTQSLGLAKALGWPYEVKALRFTSLVHLHDVLLGMFGSTRLGLQRTQSAVLTRPWPDLVITTGWRTAHIARWIKKQSHDHTRLVQMGRKGTHVARLYDLAISCRYFRLPPHSRRIETLVPLTAVSSEQLRQAAERRPTIGVEAVNVIKRVDLAHDCRDVVVHVG